MAPSSSSSSKWRALQRRHKWSYDALRLPPARLQPLLQEPAPFFQALVDMLALPSTHAQLAALKTLIASFLDLLRNPHTPPHLLDLAISVFLDLLFVENSLPLHRSLLSCLAQLPPPSHDAVRRAFQRCCHHYGLSGGSPPRKFALAAVTSSMISLPKPGLVKELLQTFSPVITECLSHGVHSLLEEARDGRHPSPSSMEECQDAMSSLYYMLQYFSHNLSVPCLVSDWKTRKVTADESPHGNNDRSASPERLFEAPPSAEGSHEEISENLRVVCLAEGKSCGDARPDISVFHAAVDVILDVLQTVYLSRDCLIAAGVGLCAAAQFQTNHSELATMLANVLFTTPSTGLAMLTNEGLKRWHPCQTSLEASIFQLRGTLLVDEVKKFTDFGRLCVLRGLLTAIPRPALNMNLVCTSKCEKEAGASVCKGQEDELLVWTLLFDGILPSLCELCESSVDSHFKFHSVTALQICLQQIKASITMEITTSAMEELRCTTHHLSLLVRPYRPMSDASVCRLLQIVWNNWEDPLNQTVKQIQVVFDLLVDVHCLCFDSKTLGICGEEKKVDKEERTKGFLDDITANLLSAGGHRKGRYVPLASISLRIGALTLLKMSPNLLFQTVNAMLDDDVCCSASAFLKAFLERLREDCWSSEGDVMEGSIVFRRLCLPSIILGIVSGNSRLRVNLNTYALPVALQIDSDAILPMLAFALDGTVPDVEETFSWGELEGSIGLPPQLTMNQRVALLIGLLKVSRMLALMEGDLCCLSEDVASVSIQGCRYKYSSGAMAFVSIKRNVFHIPLTLLELAVTHSEDSLRIDAAEALCLNPKTATMPSFLELALLRVSIPLNMRCSSTSFRMKWTSLFKRFFLRVRTAVDRQVKADVLKSRERNIEAERNTLEDGPVVTMAVSFQHMRQFMMWFSQLLIFSIYPSAPYERKNMAMELFAAMLEVWSVTKLDEGSCSQSPSLFLSKTPGYCLCDESIMSKDATMVILCALVDSWDKLREGAFKILSSYPSPLPGFESASGVERVLKWVTSLVNSPRVRESDAGALALRLMFRKYVVEEGWTLKLHPNLIVASPNSLHKDERRLKVGAAIGEYVQSLNDWLEWGVIEGEKDLLKACRHSFVHGTLLAFRYTVDELDWNSSFLTREASQLRVAIARLLVLLRRVTAVALWVVSANALNMPDTLIRSPEQGNLDLELLLGDDETRAINEWSGIAAEEEDEEEVGFMAPTEQAIMVGCWLAMKEVSLLLGTVTRKVPLPGCSNGEVGADGDPVVMLDLTQLELIGAHFLQVLLLMKHNGAVDKTRAGFVALCNRLLCASDPRLNKMPELWLQQLMDHTAAKGQSVNDLLRRSAGIPAAFLALFLAEPEGAPKKLLFMAMRWLIDRVKSFLSGSQVDVQVDSLSTSSDMTDRAHGIGRSPEELKARNEDVVPTVHAFNVMRVTFNDTNLSTDSSGFCAEALMLAIQAFSCHHWEVRNAATLAFTALVRRMVGFLNIQSHDSARRAITSFEFFHRYPVLHPFLLKELQSATLQLEGVIGDGLARARNLSGMLHPSLVPVLIILSHLKPSIINSSADDWLSPAAFILYVSRCATQSNLKVRIIASRALAPLIAADKLPRVLYELAKRLPMRAKTDMTDYSSREKSVDMFCSAKLDIQSGAIGYSSGSWSSFNTIHGILSQMQSLLASNCANLPPNSGISNDIVCALSPVMKRVNICRMYHCPIVAGTFLDVIHGLLKVEETCDSAASPTVFWKLLIQASAAFLDGAHEQASHQALRDSTRVALRESACKLYFRAVLMRWDSMCREDSGDFPYEYDEKDGFGFDISPFSPQKHGRTPGLFLRRMKDCIFDPMYEVRLAVLKSMKGLFDLIQLKSDMKDAVVFVRHNMRWVAHCLKPLLLDCLKVETHPRCLRHALRNYFTLCMLHVRVQAGSMGLDDSLSYELQRDSLLMKRPCDQFDRKISGSDISILEVWRLFLHLFRTAKHVKTQEVSIRCLGFCIRQITEGMGNFVRSSFIDSSQEDKDAYNDFLCFVKEHLYVWLELIQKHSGASEPVMLRRATAEAIVASGLLEQAEHVISHNHKHCPCGLSAADCIANWDETEQGMGGVLSVEWYAKAVLDVWFLCTKLLEDEDINLRERLAMSVLRVVSSTSDGQLGPAEIDFVPAQVEMVLQLSFEFLTSRFCNSVIYIDCLARWILNGVADMHFMREDGDLVRCLFDKEADNHHEESLLFIQLCCLHLDRILNKVGWLGSSLVPKVGGDTEIYCTYGLFKFAQYWRMKILTHLKFSVERCLALEGTRQWLGGLSNHPDVFKALYPLLLGLLIFTGSSDAANDDVSGLCAGTKTLSTGLIEITKMMTPLMSNPLIFNLLLRVLKAYEVQLGVQLGSCSLQSSKEGAFLEDFDPFFLLK